MAESYDKGIGSLFLDYLRGDVQSQGDIRYSAGLADRYGDDVSDKPYTQELYGDNPNFMSKLQARGYSFDSDGRPTTRRDVPTVQELIDAMESAAKDIAQGGGTAKLAFDRLSSVSKALFPDQNVGKPTSEKEYVQAVNALMGRFKRFMTQETGNGISNVDVSIWTEEIMKKRAKPKPTRIIERAAEAPAAVVPTVTPSFNRY